MIDQDIKVDRRIQRTRQLLRDALMALVVARNDYNSIAIQDITDQANVSRTTFYLHFRDKDELLFTSLEEIYDELVATYTPQTRDDVIKSMSGSFEFADFEHVAQYADFYRVMISDHGSAAFVARIQHYLAHFIQRRILDPLLEAGQEYPIPIDFVAHYMAGAEIGIIRWWLETGMKQTPQEMARMQVELCTADIQRLAGLQRGVSVTGL
jgi:AcrR family transcriptional regulator